MTEPNVTRSTENVMTTSTTSTTLSDSVRDADAYQDIVHAIPERDLEASTTFRWMTSVVTQPTRSLLSRGLFCSLAGGIANVIRLSSITCVFGGAFIIAYIILVTVFACPLVLLEASIGQFAGRSASQLWTALPFLKGVGILQGISSFILLMFYPVYMSYALYYFIAAVINAYPLQECQSLVEPCASAALDYTDSEKCFVCVVGNNSMADPISWQLFVCLAISWCLIALATLCVGLRSTASTAVATFWIVFSLLIALLTHAIIVGVNSPEIWSNMWQWDQLSNSQVWFAALIQVIFSFHLFFGNLITIISKSAFNNNVTRTSIVYVVSNLLTGLIASFSIYTLYAYYGASQQLSSSFKDAELFSAITVVYSSTINGNTAWAIVAFLTMVLAGLISTTALFHSLLRTLVEEFDWLKRRPRNSVFVGIGFCVVGLLIGLCCFTKNGLELSYVFDRSSVGIALICSFCWLIGFIWIYGFSSLSLDLEFMTNHAYCLFWKFVWGMWCPLVIAGIIIWRLIALILENNPVVFANRPRWSLWTMLTLYVVAIIILITSSVVQVARQIDFSWSRKFRHSLRPLKNWGPSDPYDYRQWQRWKSHSPNDVRQRRSRLYFHLHKKYADTTSGGHTGDLSQVSTLSFDRKSSE